MSTALFPAALAVTTIIAAGAAGVDWRAHRVPTALVAAASAPVVIAIVIADGVRDRLSAVALGSFVMALPLLLIHLLAPAAMGFGDVKLAAVLGGAVGLIAPALVVPALAVAAGLTLVLSVCTRRGAVPFAPGLVAGACAALALGTFEGWTVAA
jgi:leader peptidase (prepilin peptidase)/N-methyltransferase